MPMYVAKHRKGEVGQKSPHFHKAYIHDCLALIWHIKTFEKLTIGKDFGRYLHLFG
jgi:hypothetical protein